MCPGLPEMTIAETPVLNSPGDMASVLSQRPGTQVLPRRPHAAEIRSFSWNLLHRWESYLHVLVNLTNRQAKGKTLPPEVAQKGGLGYMGASGEGLWSGFFGRRPNISGDPARYVAQVQISSTLEHSARSAASDLVEIVDRAMRCLSGVSRVALLVGEGLYR